MGDQPRTITVKRGVRYNWRESLESILEDGELSKFTVKPSGTLHLYITRPKKNKTISAKSWKGLRKKKKVCTISSLIHSARNMVNPWDSKCRTVREQCVQTDCTIPVCIELDDTEELCPCDVRLSSPISNNAPKLKKGYFHEHNRPPFKEIAEPTFEKSRLPQRGIAVPKTKPRRNPQQMKQSEPQSPKQSATQTLLERALKPSQSESLPVPPKDNRSSKSSPPPSKYKESSPQKLSNEKPSVPSIRPSKDSILQMDSAASRRMLIPNKDLPSNKEKSPSPQPHSKMLLPSPQRSERDSDSETAEGKIKSGLASQSSGKRQSESLKPKRSKSPDRTENSQKPTVGLAQLASLNGSLFRCGSQSKFKGDHGRRKFHNRWENSRGDSWDSHVRNRLHQREQYDTSSQYQLPRDDGLLERCHNYIEDSTQRNLRETLWKLYSSHNHLGPPSKGNITELAYDRIVKLRRKNGSYRIPNVAQDTSTNYEYANARKPQSRYYPSKLTHWPSPKYSNYEYSDIEHKVYQHTDAGRDQDIGSISADSSEIDLNHLIPNRLRKVYSYYEIVSEPPFAEMAPNTKLPPGNATKITTTEVHPAATISQLSIEKSTNDVQEFLLQVKNVLSRYFNENCKGKGKLSDKCRVLEKLNGMKFKDEKKNTTRENKKLQQEKKQKSERKKSLKLMGLRYCY